MPDHDSTNDDELDDDLELEPVDPEILKHRQERAKQKTREAEDAIDINAVFEQDDLDDPIDLEQLKKFRFTTRHLLIVTAVLAMVMTMYIKLDGCMGLFVSGCVALGAGWWFVLREERRRLEKIAARRERYAERHAARRSVEDGEPTPTPKIKAEKFEQINADWERENEAQPAFRFAFSMKELLGTLTVAALILGFAPYSRLSNCGNVAWFRGAGRFARAGPSGSNCRRSSYSAGGCCSCCILFLPCGERLEILSRFNPARRATLAYSSPTHRAAPHRCLKSCRGRREYQNARRAAPRPIGVAPGFLARPSCTPTPDRAS